MGRSPACPKVCTDHVLEYISLRNRMDSLSDCPLVTSPLLLLSSGVAHHWFALHLHSTSWGPSLSLPPMPIPVIHHLPICSSCISGLSTTLSSESPHILCTGSPAICVLDLLTSCLITSGSPTYQTLSISFRLFAYLTYCTAQRKGTSCGQSESRLRVESMVKIFLDLYTAHLLTVT